MIKNLKNLRIENNYTQKEIAELLNISITGYASWEQGLSEPNSQYLINLANIYKCSVDYILSRETEDGVIVISDSLDSYTEDERELINEYNRLTNDEKNMVKGYIKGIVDSQTRFDKKQA